MSSPTPDPVSPNPSQELDERPHKPADDTEQVYFEGSPLLRGEVGKMTLWFGIGLLLIVLALCNWIMDWRWPMLIPLLLILAGALLIVIPIVLMKTIRYRISNYRIDHERGLLSKNIDTLELWHVEDIKFHQSLLDRIFNVGTITVLSHDETTPTLSLRGVPNPRPLFDNLKQRIIAVKRQRGVIKMDTGS